MTPAELEVRESVTGKLCPTSFICHNLILHNIIGCLLGEYWFSAAIVSITCDQYGYIYGKTLASAYHNNKLCRRETLIKDILKIADEQRLTNKERTYLLNRIPDASPKQAS